MTEKKTAIVVLPVLNEEERIATLVSGIYKYGAGLINKVIVVVDNGTVDGSREKAASAGALVLDNGPIKGVGAAIRRGIEYGLKNETDICIIMGGDSQDDPQDIPRVLAPLLNKECVFVQGSRYLDGQRTINMPISRALLTRLYTLGFRIVCGFPATDASNGFRAFYLKIIKEIDLWQPSLDKYALENFLYAQVVRRGFKIREVAVTKKFDRSLGYSHMFVWKDNSFWAVIKGRITAEKPVIPT